MKNNDLGFFMRLMELVGWGMTPKNFDRILKFSPSGCFIAEEGGKDLGMVASVNYGEVAWIGNLVVVSESRGRGIGSMLMQQAMDYLVSSGTKTIKLDGVQSAISLYHRLGFKEEYLSLRFTGVAEKHAEIECKPMRKEDMNKISELDLSVFKAPRRELLEYVYSQYPEICFTSWVNRELVGFIIAKDGKDQVKIGPWIVKHEHNDVEYCKP